MTDPPSRWTRAVQSKPPAGCTIVRAMSNTDPFTQALNKGLADLRAVLEDATERFESEMERVRQSSSAAVPTSLPTSAHDALNQMDRLARFLRSEAATAAGDVSDGLAAAMEEFSKFIYAAVPGLEEQIESAGSTFQQWVKQATETAGEMSGAASAAMGKAASKATGATRKVTAKRGAAKKVSGVPDGTEQPAASGAAPAKKSAKKSGAKKASAKKASAKKASPRKAVKKTTKKASAKKAPAKKAAEKTTKKAPAKKAAKKTTKKAAKKSAEKP